MISLRGLRPGSKVCSEHMNDWQYLSLGDLEQNEFFPKVNLEAFFCLNVLLWSRDLSHNPNLKMKRIVELAANLYFVWINKLAFLKRDKDT